MEKIRLVLKKFKKKIKGPLFECACWIFYYCGLFRLMLRIRLWQGKNLSILMFHRICDGRHMGLPTITLGQQHFKSFIKFLRKHYRIQQLDSTLERFYRRQKFSAPVAVLTFDDGYKETLYQALPILKQENMPSLCFIPTDFPEKEESFWWDRTYVFLKYAPWNMVYELIQTSESFKILEEKWKPLLFLEGREKDDFVYQCIHQLQEMDSHLMDEFQSRLKSVYQKELERHYPISRSLNWDEIAFLPKYGMDVGSHTLSHRFLPYLTAQEQMKEIVRSKKILEQHLKAISKVFSYPAGKYNQDVIFKVQEAGHEGALTTEQGINSPQMSPFELKRINVWDGMVTNSRGEFSKAICAWRLIWP